jgi:hypothetical protein
MSGSNRNFRRSEKLRLLLPRALKSTRSAAEFTQREKAARSAAEGRHPDKELSVAVDGRAE